VSARLTTLVETIAGVDIYLLDQIARGRIVASDRVLDAGCGEGRNAAILMRLGCDVHAVDREPAAIGAVRAMAARIAPELPATNFRAEPLETLTFAAASIDVVVCSAVLHFAADDRQFDAMLAAMWRVLRPGGLFFCRLATTIGLEHAKSTRLKSDERLYRLGDRSTRYLADESQITSAMATLGGQFADPLKTTIVQGQRCMTTWVARRNG
jgi:2-polyprenyl-3-methyl-5-hydroxy-6-metoxy-1,4-benzoquinol methylase